MTSQSLGPLVLPPAPLRLIELVAAPAAIVRRGVAALEKGKGIEAFAGAGKADAGRRPARYESALRLVAQHRDELGAIVGLAAERLVRPDDRGARQMGRPQAIAHGPRGGGGGERGSC